MNGISCLKYITEHFKSCLDLNSKQKRSMTPFFRVRYNFTKAKWNTVKQSQVWGSCTNSLVKFLWLPCFPSHWPSYVPSNSNQMFLVSPFLPYQPDSLPSRVYDRLALKKGENGNEVEDLTNTHTHSGVH